MALGATNYRLIKNNNFYAEPRINALLKCLLYKSLTNNILKAVKIKWACRLLAKFLHAKCHFEFSLCNCMITQRYYYLVPTKGPVRFYVIKVLII